MAVLNLELVDCVPLLRIQIKVALAILFFSEATSQDGKSFHECTESQEVYEGNEGKESDDATD